jgi:hypothetical protein
LSVALLVSGCAAGGERAGTRGVALDAASRASGYAPVWVNSDLRPLGQPIAIGSVVVGIVIDDRDQLFVVAIDPATGNERWRQQTAPSVIAREVELRAVPISGAAVAYLRPKSQAFGARATGGYAELVIADARTGQDLAESPPAVFGSLPYPCGNARDACSVSRAVHQSSAHHHRLEVATGAWLEQREELPQQARMLDGDGLLDLGDRPDDALGWLRDGKLRWRAPVRAAFPAGFSSDHGWEWSLYDAQRAIVGSLGGAPVTSDGTRVYDLSRTQATAGLSEDTGAVLWRDSGSFIGCHLGARSAGCPVRCRSRGVLSVSPDERGSVKDLEVTVEGFEPMTGETTWSVAMGPVEALAVPSQAAIAVAGPAQVVVTGAAGPVVLDYAVGSVTAPDPGETFWCMTTIHYELPRERLSSDGVLADTRTGGQFAAICDSQGRPSTLLPGMTATLGASVQVGNYAVIAARHGYLGFRLR